jgi:hypothetical protein
VTIVKITDLYVTWKKVTAAFIRALIQSEYQKAKKGEPQKQTYA